MSNKPNHSANRNRTAARVAAAEAQKPGGSTLPWILAAVGVVVVFALFLAIRASSSSSTTASRPPPAGSAAGTVVQGNLSTADVAVAGNALPAFPDKPGTPDPALGAKAPTLTGKGFDGSPLTVGGAGQPTVVMFVAHWCPHCQREVPALQAEFNQKGLPAGVQLFAVSTSVKEDAANYPPVSWLVKEGWTVPTLVDSADGTAATAYGLGGFPFFVALDASGNVVARTSGELTLEQFNALVVAAKGTPASSTSSVAAR